jgi:protease-4
MKRTSLTFLVVLILVGFVALALYLAAWVSRPTPIAQETILEIDLERVYPEHVPFQSLTSGFLDEITTLRRVVDTIDRAARDDRVVAIVGRIGSVPMGMGATQELRAAVERFRESGKPAVAFSETFGEWGPGNVALYMATAFDTVYMQPSGDVGLTGLIYEAEFYSGLLEKLDMTPRMGQRYEYKNAANSFLESELTEPHREALQALADSHLAQVVAAVAESRGLDESEVRALANGGPYLGVEALEAGLIDGLRYRDAVDEQLREQFPDAEFVSLTRYQRRSTGSRNFGLGSGSGTKVALIYGVGAVTRGDSGYDPFFGSVTMGSATVAKAFRDAIDDDEVEAILFRVNSPGGSYVASDTIWRETVRAREAGKPVIVSMGNVAGSGGYFVAMAAHTIVAQPGTVTGSIGVYGGKLLSRGLFAKAGITFDEVVTGDRARLWSPNHDYTDEGWQRIQDSLDRIYHDFTTKVAEGRSMSREEVHEIARGRIWTGVDALERGLVDELGGFAEAKAAVRRSLELGDDARLRLVQFPRPLTPFELFREGRFMAAPGADATLSRLAEIARPVYGVARELGLAGPPVGPLTLWLPVDGLTSR